MDSDRLFRTLREKRLAPEVVQKIINDFVNDHRISEQERTSRHGFLSWFDDDEFIRVLVSRVSFFSSVILSESTPNLQQHSVQTVYDEMRLQYLMGIHAKLAAFTLSTFIDQRQAVTFTILPATKLKIVSSLRALNLQSTQVTGATETQVNKSLFLDQIKP